MKRTCLMLAAVAFSAGLWSQSQPTSSKNGIAVDANRGLSADTLFRPSPLYLEYFAEADAAYYNDTLPIRSTPLDPYYFQLFVPLTYYNAPVHQAFYPDGPVVRELEGLSPYANLLPSVDPALDGIRRARREVNRVLLGTYLALPGDVACTEEEISQRRVVQAETKEEAPKVKVFNLFSPEPEKGGTAVASMEAAIRKPNFWTTGGDGSLQFTQNYISENWYKGGESTNSMVAQLRLFANYDDKQRLEWDNELFFNLGFITAPSDTLHKYRPNNDLLRLTSKLGIKAVARWYYALSVEFRTQFFSNYKINSDVKQSAFMTPTELKVGLGMDYKLARKKINLSLMLAPLSYNLLYLMDPDVAPSGFGVDEGKCLKNEVGSRMQMNYTWKIIPSITWESRLSYFTNYKRIEAEWENTFNFVLNRYLSTKLFVHARYDDSVAPRCGENYFQLKELLSFGINYKW